MQSPFEAVGGRSKPLPLFGVRAGVLGCIGRLFLDDCLFDDRLSNDDLQPSA
jgi:hypothetical protein